MGAKRAMMVKEAQQRPLDCGDEVFAKRVEREDPYQVSRQEKLLKLALRSALRALCVVWCSVALLACSAIELRGKELIGKPAPDARLMRIDGSEFPLSAQSGRATALLFWATWCTHSKSIIEQYERLARRFSKRGDIDFYAISVDKNEDLPELKRRIQSQDLRTIIHIFSGNESQDDAFLNFEGKSVPYLVYIDRMGIVRVVESDLETLEVYLKGEFGE